MTIKKIAVVGANLEIAHIFKGSLPDNPDFNYEYFIVHDLAKFKSQIYDIIIFLNPSNDLKLFYDFASSVRSRTNIPIFLIYNKIDVTHLDNLFKFMPVFLSNFRVEPNEFEVKIEVAMGLFAKIRDSMNIPFSLYHSLYSSFAEAMIICDSKGKILSFNPAAAEMFDLIGERFSEKSFYDLIVLDDNREDFKRDFGIWINNPEKIVFECPLVSRVNHYFPAELSLMPITETIGNFILVHCRDISERLNSNDEVNRLIEEIQYSKDIIEQNASELVNLNTELQESELKLKELNSSKDKFFSIIAHDLKNPFQNLLGLTDIMAKDFDKLNQEEISLFMKGLNESAHNLFKLLENLLSWARMQQGAMDYNPGFVSLDEISAIALKLIEPQAIEKSIELKLELESNLIVYCDINMVSAIIRNLLSNAVKFTRDGGIIRLCTERMNDYYAKVRIMDSGVGIDEMTLAKLFRIDEHHTSAGTRNEMGTGLGLILCRELIEKNNGKIFVSSIVNQGTTFSFTLPLKNLKTI